MPIQEIMNITALGSREQKTAIALAMHCAPLLKGSKLANIMTVDRSQLTAVRLLLRNTSISCRFLGRGEEKGILYLYREKELKEYLSLARIGDFLAAYGYRGKDFQEMLNRLSERVVMHGSGEAFPHEIGVFLGYPLEDVKGFIENEGRNFIYLGYWKVYHDLQGAIRLFQRYDEEREQAVNEIILGKTIQEIAV